MAKIMLVEDDNNLREIYEARLLAEGYEIVAAKDGEEALAMAVKEKPDLIIADVMMPKISGFDMLDILRGAPETKDTKVIVMTALSQAEDKARADKLGADRYLIKSQVTLEDVARAAREVLEGARPATPGASAPVAGPPASPAPQTATPAAVPVSEPPAPTTPAAQTTKDEEAEVEAQIKSFESGIPSKDLPKQETKEPVKEPKEIAKPPKSGGVDLPSSHKKVIEPLNDISAKKPDINELLAKEEAAEQADMPVVTPPANTLIDAASSKTPSVEMADPGSDSKPHSPGQVIGPEQTPGSDPGDPNAVAL